MSTNIFITTELRLAERNFKTVLHILLVLLGRIFFFCPLNMGETLFRKLKKSKSVEKRTEI